MVRKVNRSSGAGANHRARCGRPSRCEREEIEVLAMRSDAATTASEPRMGSVLPIVQDHHDDERHKRPAFLAREWDLLPELRENPCKRTSLRTTLMGRWIPITPRKLASFSGRASLPFTQEITGSNPVGGTRGLPLLAGFWTGMGPARRSVCRAHGSAVEAFVGTTGSARHRCPHRHPDRRWVHDPLVCGNRSSEIL
jgi:hypothetical protein